MIELLLIVIICILWPPAIGIIIGGFILFYVLIGIRNVYDWLFN